MGSNFANDLSVMDNLDIETQIGIHLSSNHYPPVPKSMVQPCIEAIDAVNDLEMLKLLKQLQIDCENVDADFVKVINALGDQLSLSQEKNNYLESQVSKKDDELRNIRSALDSCQSADTLSTEIEGVYKDEIVELKREIRRQKIDKGISIGLNVLQVIAAVAYFIKN